MNPDGDSQLGWFVIHDVSQERRPADMAKALSVDLRNWVLTAVAGGMTYWVV